jgi:hypothetical protein
MAAVRNHRTSGARAKSDRVILSRKRYERLLEDSHDLVVVAERKKESTISMAEMTKRLRKSGLL